MSNAADAVVLAGTVRRQRVVIGGMGVALAILAGVGLGQGPGAGGSPAAREVTHYTAGDDRLYRVWDDGTIEYLIVDFANGSVEGIPGWARVQIDHSLTRDRMGNEVRR